METGESNDVGGFGGNLFAGYNINSIMAVELGYTTYGTSKYSTDQEQYVGVSKQGWAYESTNSASIKYSTYSLDLFLKATTPSFGPFSAFAKAGVSYVNQSVDYQNPAGAPIINVNNDTLATPDAGTNTYTAYRPAGGLGINYKINEHFTSSFFAQGFLGRGDMETDKDAIASGYLIGASLTYNFI
ncbi:MAG: outer membrane beta-barrel protein [Gammaproteobacteria bacterium]|nr:outer membrane beta-barrel protein [Gammaproteobacteria bacterium]